MAYDKRTAYLDFYKQLPTFVPFLSSFFKTGPRDIVNADSVKIDVMRGGRKVAPVVSDITALGGRIKKSEYTNKEFKPPVVAIGVDFNPADLISKAFGKSEYDSAQMEYQVQLQDRIADAMTEIEAQINRNIEYQASQVFQNSAVVNLYDNNGNLAYTIDFKGKGSHFPTASINWSNEDADPDADIYNLDLQIKQDGHVNVKNIVFGRQALHDYLLNYKIQDKFDVRRLNSGMYNPQMDNPAVTSLGEFIIGPKRYDAWLYDEYYDDPVTGDVTPFINPDNVLLLPAAGTINVDFRKIYCRVPTIIGTDPRFENLVPVNLNLGDRAYTARIWTDDAADALLVELKTRPLLIPVSIDTFGCIATGA